MSKEKVDIEKLNTTSGLFILVGMLAFPISIGFMAGAGVGWLVFSILMIAGAYRISYVIRKEKKRREASGE